MSDGEEYEEEVATPEEALQICDFFIMSSPIGEVDEVVTDLKTLVNKNEEVLTDAALAEILQSYNTQMMETGKSPDTDEPLIVCAQGKVSANTFVDPSTGNVHTYDHAQRKFTSTTDEKSDVPAEIGAYRSAIARAARDYLTENYTRGKAASTTYANADGTVTVAIAAKNIHLGNFWTGSIRATYTLNVSSQGDAKIAASIKISSHYFENANVQLDANKEAELDVEVGDAKATANSVKSAINLFESAYQSSLEEMYVNMRRKTFRSMRQFLPPDKQFLNWNINAHSVASTLR